MDWRRPWLAPYADTAAPLLGPAAWRQTLNAIAVTRDLRNHRDLPVHFIAQDELPAGTPYEAHISATGGVPTRDNLHDFFNALVWLTFPRIKVQLNAIQANEIARADQGREAGDNTNRGRVRDAATIFDENAALFVVRDPALIDLCRNHDWQELFLARRPEFHREIEVWLFGHALLEKLVTPFKSITAHAWPIIVEETFFALPQRNRQKWLDCFISRRLMRCGLSMADFMPLPVMGIPEWSGKQDEAFYGDTKVFRPKRARRS